MQKKIHFVKHVGEKHVHSCHCNCFCDVNFTSNSLKNCLAFVQADDYTIILTLLMKEQLFF